MFRFISSNEPSPQSGVRRSGPTLNRWQRREIFREMALAELRYQNVDDWRRKRLVQYAATLQLSATEAGRLLEEAQKELDQEFKAAEGELQPSLTYVDSQPAGSWRAGWPIFAGVAMLAGAVLLNYLYWR